MWVCVFAWLWQLCRADRLVHRFSFDPKDIAVVKIEYARFLGVYTADVALASAALTSAQQAEPSWAGEFEVFTRLRSLKQKAEVRWAWRLRLAVLFPRADMHMGCQSESIGADKGLDLITLVEHRKRLESALKHHRRALVHAIRAYSALHAAELPNGELSERHMASVGREVELFNQAATSAQRHYHKLVKARANRQLLDMSVAMLCCDVMWMVGLCSTYPARFALFAKHVSQDQELSATIT